MTVQDICNIANGNFNSVNKQVGVLFHDNGFMRYRKLTAENFYYWWNEVKDLQEEKANKSLFTYEWSDMVLTHKFDFLLSLVKYHDQLGSIYKIINNALNLLAAKYDGVNTNTGKRCYDEVWEMYYGRRKSASKQLELF